MKKIISLAILICLSVAFLNAQTFSEWFRQKKTQIKYLVAQIAADEVFLKELSKGYGVARSGLNFIGDMKEGEFDLHTAYFRSLKMVDPSVAKYSKIEGIISFQTGINSILKKMLQTKNMNGAEMNYLNAVYINMINECNNSINELIDITTDNSYTMKDEERINRIDALYDDMKNKYAFSQNFYSETLLLSAERQSEINEINGSIINNGPQQ